MQIRVAHGYLVSQFLSSRPNQRDEKWGGSLENRLRFVIDLYRATRKKVGESFPVGIKLNSADFMKGGFTEEESMQVVQALSREDINLIEISGGTYERPSMMGSKNKSGLVKASIAKRKAYILDYMVKVRELVSTPLVVTGCFEQHRQ